MKSYVYLSPAVAQQILEIKRSIYLKMNGVTADCMRDSGVLYSKNYGVSLPELRQMAVRIDKNAALANALWAEKIRETMILATLIYPVTDFDARKADEWMPDICTLELAENVSRNLLCYQSYMEQKSIEWAMSDDPWISSVAYFAAAFGIKMLPEESKKQLVQLMLHPKNITEVAVYRSMALFLRKYASENKEMGIDLLIRFCSFEKAPELGKRIIYEELKTEVEYGL